MLVTHKIQKGLASETRSDMLRWIHAKERCLSSSSDRQILCSYKQRCVCGQQYWHKGRWRVFGETRILIHSQRENKWINCFGEQFVNTKLIWRCMYLTAQQFYSKVCRPRRKALTYVHRETQTKFSIGHCLKEQKKSGNHLTWFLGWENGKKSWHSSSRDNTELKTNEAKPCDGHGYISKASWSVFCKVSFKRQRGLRFHLCKNLKHTCHL